MTRNSVDIRRNDGTSMVVPPSELERLGEALRGRILLPEDAGFAEATRVWNGMVARTPALVAQPASTEDVATIVRFARERSLLMSVRGGGHNIAGTALAEGGLTVDMSLLRSVTVDPRLRTADARPGCTIGDVDQSTQRLGLATVLGFVSETGLAGLTLGGGWGYLTRRFGWTVDNLEEVDIVTADGRVRTANERAHADLFWAVRGGGGNFGIVTRFRYRLHPVGPTIVGGLMAWDAERSHEILSAYRAITQDAPEELTLAMVVRLAPPAPFVPEAWRGKPIVAMVVCYTGDDAATALAPFRRLPDPIIDTVGDLPYVALQSMLNANEPKGPHRYWKTEFFPDLSEGFLDRFREGALGLTSPLCQSVVFHLAGAINRKADDEGAVGNRDARYIAGFAGTWPEDAPADPHVAWVRSAWEGVRGYSTGGNYVNFQLAEDGPDRLMDAYGANFARLTEVKGTYDPDNLFRVNRNIPPEVASA